MIVPVFDQNPNETHNAFNQNFLKQLPGFIMCLDTSNKISYCNSQAVHLLGFDNDDEVIGVSTADVRCKAAEYSDVFNQQNQLVMENNIPLKIIDVHPFRNNQIFTFLTQKAPLYDLNNKIIGTLMHLTEITHHSLQNISIALANANEKYAAKKNVIQSSYPISNILEFEGLSKREIECLFHYIRGKTAGKISDILFISKRTVEKHISNIKRKLQCVTKSDLIEKSVENNFIACIPESIFLKSNINISVII